MGTKLRALYQHRKGRDLFDLWLWLSRSLVDAAKVVDCFRHYMDREGHAITRAEFEQNLHVKANDPAFMGDMAPLLRPDIRYNAPTALEFVRAQHIALLPGDPWRGAGT